MLKVMRLLISGLLLLCFAFFYWLDSAPAHSTAPASPGESSFFAPSGEVFGQDNGEIQDVSSDPSIPVGSLALRLYSEPGGQPIDQARVVLDAWEGQSLGDEISACSEADGLCTFERLPAGTYAYRVHQPGRDQQWSGKIELGAGVSLLKRVDLSELSTAH